MSLRKIAKILGISPTYLSLLLNGKRPWRGNLKERYEELVNTFVNTNGHNRYEITGAQEGIRTPTPDKGKRILSPVFSVRPCVLQSTPFLINPSIVP